MTIRTFFSAHWVHLTWVLAACLTGGASAQSRTQLSPDGPFPPARWQHSALSVIDQALTWNTFLGSAGYDDFGWGVAVDNSGNIYVTGRSAQSWGSHPVTAFTSGVINSFAAKLDSNGNLVWNTFIAGDHHRWASAIALDSSGNIYVSGISQPRGGGPTDAFLTKLNASGYQQWDVIFSQNTSLVNPGPLGMAIDSSGNIYITGSYDRSWGNPRNNYSSNFDVCVAKFNSSGSLLWNTFLGGTNAEGGKSIAADSSGNIYVTGYSYGTWGKPIEPFPGFSGATNAFVAKLNSEGFLQWNTFLGVADASDFGWGIGVDSPGNVYVTGFSYASWGSPISPFIGGTGGSNFVAKLNSSGVRQWNTFLGGAHYDDYTGNALGMTVALCAYDDETPTRL